MGRGNIQLAELLPRHAASSLDHLYCAVRGSSGVCKACRRGSSPHYLVRLHVPQQGRVLPSHLLFAQLMVRVTACLLPPAASCFVQRPRQAT